MKKVIVNLSIPDRNGKFPLHLRDSNRICGDSSIITEVSRGDIIVWKRDCRSRIKRITNLHFDKADELFSRGPFKGFFSRWTAKISDKAKGKYPYRIDYIACKSRKVDNNVKKANGEPAPIIKIKE